jgi:hypothetical protein
MMVVIYHARYSPNNDYKPQIKSTRSDLNGSWCYKTSNIFLGKVLPCDNKMFGFFSNFQKFNAILIFFPNLWKPEN